MPSPDLAGYHLVNLLARSSSNQRLSHSKHQTEWGVLNTIWLSLEYFTQKNNSQLTFWQIDKKLLQHHTLKYIDLAANMRLVNMQM